VNSFKSVHFSYRYAEPKAGTIYFFYKFLYEEICAIVWTHVTTYICTVVYLKNECVLCLSDDLSMRIAGVRLHDVRNDRDMVVGLAASEMTELGEETIARVASTLRTASSRRDGGTKTC
jgi:hypothetical protein